jgi:hypothetical protein
MRNILLVIAIVLFTCASGFVRAQSPVDSCRAVTLKRPQVQARAAVDLANYLRTNIDSTLLPAGNTSAIFQVQTDCSGAVIKVIALKAYLSAALCDRILELLRSSGTWQPARDEGYFVGTVTTLR